MFASGQIKIGPIPVIIGLIKSTGTPVGIFLFFPLLGFSKSQNHDRPKNRVVIDYTT